MANRERFPTNAYIEFYEADDDIPTARVYCSHNGFPTSAATRLGVAERLKNMAPTRQTTAVATRYVAKYGKTSSSMFTAFIEDASTPLEQEVVFIYAVRCYEGHFHITVFEPFYENGQMTRLQQLPESMWRTPFHNWRYTSVEDFTNGRAHQNKR